MPRNEGRDERYAEETRRGREEEEMEEMEEREECAGVGCPWIGLHALL